MRTGTVWVLAVMLSIGPVSQTGATRIEVVTDGSQPALQLLMDDIAGEVQPVVILIPPGEWLMVGTVTVSQDNVTVLGAGAARCRFYRTHEENTAIFMVRNADNVRFSGLMLAGNADPGSSSSEYGISLNNVSNLRVDHCAFEHSGFGGVRTTGACTGVVDHCDFDQIYKPAIANLGYGVVVYGTGTSENEPYGSERATFVEDSDFSGCRHALASNNGARYVLRYSRIIQNEVSHAVDTHGHEYGSTVGTEWADVYRNVIEEPVWDNYAVVIRGGGGLIWENTIRDYSTAVRLVENTDQDTGPVYIWDNILDPSGMTLINASPDTTPTPPADGVPEYATSAPAGYTPYPYPHPLVVDLVAAAGPDMVARLRPGSGDAEVYLDGSASTAAAGSIVATRWHLGSAPLSDCARDLVRLPEGLHLLLLEVERDDGLLEHDLTVVEVLEAGDQVSSTDWNPLWFVPVVGAGQVAFSVTPSADAMDGYVAITGRIPVGAHEDNAVIVRANDTGNFDAVDGASYQAENVIPYQSGTSYAVSVSVDIGNQRYSATVNGQVLAQDYAFRSPQTALGQLVAWHSSGGLTVSNLTVSGELARPDPPCQPPDTTPPAAPTGLRVTPTP